MKYVRSNKVMNKQILFTVFIREQFLILDMAACDQSPSKRSGNSAHLQTNIAQDFLH